MAWNGRVNPDPNPADPPAKSTEDQLIDKLTAALEAKLSPINAEITAVKTKFEALETAARESVKPKETQERRPMTSVLDNEDAAFNERLGPIAVELAIARGREIERDAIERMKEEGWSSLIPQVREIFNGTEPARKAKPDYAAYCDNCVDLAIGRHAKKNGLRANGETFYLENSNTNGEQPPNRTLGRDLDWVDSKGRNHTGEEVARKLGIEDTAAFAKEFLQ